MVRRRGPIRQVRYRRRYRLASVLVIVAVVVSFVLSKWLAGPPTAPQVPEPEEATVPRKSANHAADRKLRPISGLSCDASGSLSGGPVALSSSGELL